MFLVNYISEICFFKNRDVLHVLQYVLEICAYRVLYRERLFRTFRNQVSEKLHFMIRPR